MKTNIILLYASLLILTACLTAGYLLAGYGMALLLFPPLAGILFLLYRRSDSWGASSFLLSCMGLAAAGMLLGTSTLLMILAGTAALAGWDMLRLRPQIANSLDGEADDSIRIHLRTLMAALTTGVLLALLSAGIDLQLPFLAVAAIVVLAAGSLFYGLRYLGRKIM